MRGFGAKLGQSVLGRFKLGDVGRQARTQDLNLPFIAATVEVFDLTVQSDQIDLPFISSTTVVYTPVIQPDYLELPFISPATVVYTPVIQPDYLELPFIPSSTVLYPPYLQPDFVELPFIPSKTTVYRPASVWTETTGPGNGGEVFNIQLAPTGVVVTAALSGGITSTATTLTLTGDGDLPGTGGFCVHIDDEVLYLSKIGAGSYRIVRHGMSNTSAAPHSGGSDVTWTDTYDMAAISQITLPLEIEAATETGTDTYRAWLIVSDSSQAYIGDDRYPTFVERLVGVFAPGGGSSGTNKIDLAQPSAVHTRPRLSNDCPSGMTVPARMIDTINPHDAILCRYFNTEDAVLALGPRAAVIQSWYGFERWTDADVHQDSNPYAHVIDGVKNQAFHAEEFITATLRGDDRFFTYGPPRYSHKGWPIATLTVRQGKSRIPLWTSPTWHNFNYIYTGFGIDAVFCQVLINRNDVVWHDLDPEVALPGPQDISGPDATWDDPDDYYSAVSWYVAIFGAEVTALIAGPAVNSPPTNTPPPTVVPVFTPGTGTPGTGGGGIVSPRVPEGGSGGDVTPIVEADTGLWVKTEPVALGFATSHTP